MFHLILSLSLLAALVRCEVVPGCPKFQEFIWDGQLEALEGIWYVHYMLRNINDFPIELKCFHVDWTFEQEDSILNETVRFLKTSESDGTVHTEHHIAEIRNPLRKLKWFVNEREIDYDVNVMYFDQDHIMWTQCSQSAPDGGIFYQIFLSSRSPDLFTNVNLKEQLRSILSEHYGVSVDRLTVIPQGNENQCPKVDEDPSDPSRNSSSFNVLPAFSLPAYIVLVYACTFLKVM